MEIGDVNNLLLVLVTSPPTTNRLQWEPVITGTIVSSDHRITLGVEWTCKKSVILLENQTSPPSPWRLEKEST